MPTTSVHISKVPAWLDLYYQIEWKSYEAKRMFLHASGRLQSMYDDLMKKENERADKRYNHVPAGENLKALSENDIFNITFAEVFGDEVSQNESIQKIREGFRELASMARKADGSSLQKSEG
jgi:hypothetical protein